MSKQTAVDWLWNELKAYNVNIASDLVAQFNQAKQMEKEQIMDTGNCVAEVVLTDDESYNGNKYWNEFYGGDNE